MRLPGILANFCLCLGLPNADLGRSLICTSRTVVRMTAIITTEDDFVETLDTYVAIRCAPGSHEIRGTGRSSIPAAMRISDTSTD